MPAVAEVQFKAAGNQQVVTAFKSVGTAAGESTTKIQQNSSAMKSMGQGMKGSVSGIGQVATAFATLSLSIVSTWRAYRDLGDAQIAVDKANLRVKKTTEAIRKSEAEVAKLRKESAKGGLENVAATHKIQLMEQKLAKDRKEGKKSALELKVQEDAINLARKEGVPSSKKLTDAENKLQLQKEQLGVQTDVAAEAQERFNDIQQDFYLSILPLGLSSIASLTTAFRGLGGVLKGGGGLIGGLGPIGLILGGITLAIIAFKTNFLGLRDVVGGVIDWIKERFGLWKDTIEKVFNLIKSGNWSGAFALIQEAAAKFWEDLKKSVPFFGEVESLVNKIKNGNWKGAFLQIWKAATDVWETIKKSIPFFGGVETFIRQLAAGDWQGAWNTIAAGAKTAFGAIFGEKGILNFQKMRDTAVAEFGLLQRELTKKGGPIDLIQQGLAKLGSGDVVGGFSQIWTGIDKAIGIAIARFTDWVKLNFGVDLNQVYASAQAIGTKILDGIKAGLTFIARTWIDPILASLFDPATWTSAAGAILGTIQAVGGVIFNFLAGAIQGAAKDPKGTASWWGNIGQAIWDGIVAWMTTNLPDTAAAIQSLVTSISTSMSNASIDFQNMGITAANAVIDGMKSVYESVAKGGLFDLFGGKQIRDAINSPEWKALGHMALITPEVNTKPMVADSKKAATDVSKITPSVTLKSNTKPFTQGVNRAINAVPDAVTIQIRASSSQFMAQVHNLQSNAPAGSRFRKTPTQHGYQGTVKRPTMFIAGEGGRPEDVTVRPRGSAQRGGSGGGGDRHHITISFEPAEFAQFLRYRINQNQGVFK